MHPSLQVVESLVEVDAAHALELIELALVCAVPHGRQVALNLAAIDKCLELNAGFLMIVHQLAGKLFDVGIACLLLGKLARLDLEQVTLRGLGHEVLR